MVRNVVLLTIVAVLCCAMPGSSWAMGPSTKRSTPAEAPAPNKGDFASALAWIEGVQAWMKVQTASLSPAKVENLVVEVEKTARSSYRLHDSHSEKIQASLQALEAGNWPARVFSFNLVTGKAGKRSLSSPAPKALASALEKLHDFSYTDWFGNSKKIGEEINDKLSPLYQKLADLIAATLSKVPLEKLKEGAKAKEDESVVDGVKEGEEPASSDEKAVTADSKEGEVDVLGVSMETKNSQGDPAQTDDPVDGSESPDELVEAPKVKQVAVKSGDTLGAIVKAILDELKANGVEVADIPIYGSGDSFINRVVENCSEIKDPNLIYANKTYDIPLDVFKSASGASDVKPTDKPAAESDVPAFVKNSTPVVSDEPAAESDVPAFVKNSTPVSDKPAVVSDKPKTFEDLAKDDAARLKSRPLEDLKVADAEMDALDALLDELFPAEVLQNPQSAIDRGLISVDTEGQDHDYWLKADLRNKFETLASRMDKNPGAELNRIYPRDEETEYNSFPDRPRVYEGLVNDIRALSRKLETDFGINGHDPNEVGSLAWKELVERINELRVQIRSVRSDLAKKRKKLEG